MVLRFPLSGTYVSVYNDVVFPLEFIVELFRNNIIVTRTSNRSYIVMSGINMEVNDEQY